MSRLALFATPEPCPEQATLADQPRAEFRRLLSMLDDRQLEAFVITARRIVAEHAGRGQTAQKVGARHG